MSGKGFAHEIVADVLRVKQELGRNPTRDEYHDGKLGRFPKASVELCFGNWTELMRACGLSHAKGKRKKQDIREKVFKKLQSELAAKQAESPKPPKIIHRLLCVSDLHKPYGHQDANKFLKALKEKYNFDHVLIGGDEIDAHAMSFHDADPDLLSAGHELEAAIEALKPLYELFPEADVLSSNHGDLVYRKGKHHGMPRHVLKDYRDVLLAPNGWTWAESYTFQFPDGKKAYAHHGISKDYLKASQNLGMSFIQFHFHNELGARYWAVNGELFWALQCACLIDDTSRAMAYNKLTLGRPIMGCAGVIDGLPKLFPMLLDRSGRWTGYVP